MMQKLFRRGIWAVLLLGALAMCAACEDETEDTPNPDPKPWNDEPEELESMPTYDITYRDAKSAAPIKLETHEKKTFRVALVGESCTDMRLEVEEGDFPWVRIEGTGPKKYKEGLAMELTVTVFASQDLFPREQSLYLSDGTGNRAEIVITQPGCPFSECKNYLAFLAKANLATYSALGGVFAIEPSMANAERWGEKTDEFGGLFPKPSNPKEFSQWRQKEGKFIYGIPSSKALHDLMPNLMSFGVESVSYDARPMTGKNWRTAVRYEFIRKGEGGGLKIVTRYFSDEEDISMYSYKEFWKKPAIAGSVVVRYLPALGYKFKGQRLEDRSRAGYYWTSVGYRFLFTGGGFNYSPDVLTNDQLAIRPMIVGAIGE